MATDSLALAWNPDWSVAPGEILQEALDERSMTQSELARRMDRPLKTINEIIKGKAAITPATAIQLELVLGIRAGVWNNLEKSYREHLAWTEAVQQMESAVSWARTFPLRELKDAGLLEQSTRGESGLVGAVLQFFGVSSPAAWEKTWGSPAALFRESPTFSSDVAAVAAWLRWGELEAEKAEVEEFGEDKVRALLPELRALSLTRPIGATLSKLRKRLKTVGVALVILPELPGTHISGAARWLRPNKAIVQLSLRHETDDHFWFSLYHEIQHLLAPGRKRDAVDYVDLVDVEVTEEEQRANDAARSALIDPEPFARFRNSGRFDSASIRTFAAELGIAPGIVVGRLQSDGLIDWNQQNDLKFRIHWS